MTETTGPASGGCLCGAVRYEAEGDPLEVGYCHCRSCRRQTGAPVVVFVTFLAEAVRFVGRERSTHESSPGVKRAFCGQCGTPLTWEGQSSALGKPIIEFYISTLDAPERFRPDRHWYHPERIPWFDVADDQPRFRGVGKADEAPYRHGPVIDL